MSKPWKWAKNRILDAYMKKLWATDKMKYARKCKSDPKLLNTYAKFLGVNDKGEIVCDVDLLIQGATSIKVSETWQRLQSV